jgi:AcrR family transcriptional regulator
VEAARDNVRRPVRGRRAARVRGDDRERAILATAERLLEERPLQEISVDDLARGAGISRPTFYFYFPSKDAVLLTLLDRMIEEADAGRVEVLGALPEDPAASLRKSLTAFYETFGAHRAVTLAAAEARITNAEVRELWARVMEGWVADVTAVQREWGWRPTQDLRAMCRDAWKFQQLNPFGYRTREPKEMEFQ